MNLRPLLPLGFIVSATALWFYRRRHHPLMSPEQILMLLHPGESDRLEPYILNGTSDLLGDDAEFWLAAGRWDGLRRKRHNAIVIVHFCQHIAELAQTIPNGARISEDELRRMMLRRVLICIALFGAIVEEAFRMFLPDLPHVFARVVSQLYWDMERRITTLCADVAPELLTQLYQLL